MKRRYHFRRAYSLLYDEHLLVRSLKGDLRCPLLDVRILSDVPAPAWPESPGFGVMIQQAAFRIQILLQ